MSELLSERVRGWFVGTAAAGMAAMLCIVVSASAALPESADFTSGLQPNVPEDFEPRAVGLSPQPLMVDSLGLALHPPANAAVTINRSSGQPVLTIFDSAAIPAWSVSVQHMIAGEGIDSPAAAVQDHLDKLEVSGRSFRILANEPFAAGHLCYIEQTLAEGEPFTAGYLILPSGEGVFTVFSVLAASDEFSALRPILDASFHTVNVRSVAEVSLTRRARLQTGRAVLESLTPERLRDVVGLRLMSRIYRVSAEGEQAEVGYSVLEVSEAKRGALDENRSEANYSPKEHEYGLMVRVQGRIIGDIDRGLFYDSIAAYWLAWDQSSEAWSIRGTQRQGRAARSEAETAFRTAQDIGNPRPTLTVIRDERATYERRPHEWQVPEVYLSQALGPLLGRLLPRDEREPREFAWYFYSYDAARGEPQLTQRIDRWAPTGDGSGNWLLTSRISSDAAPIETIFTETGELVRSRRADGVVTEPIHPDALERLWQRKGLPMGDEPRERRRRQPR